MCLRERKVATISLLYFQLLTLYNDSFKFSKIFFRFQKDRESRNKILREGNQTLQCTVIQNAKKIGKNQNFDCQFWKK